MVKSHIRFYGLCCLGVIACIIIVDFTQHSPASDKTFFPSFSFSYGRTAGNNSSYSDAYPDPFDSTDEHSFSQFWRLAYSKYAKLN